MTARRLTLAIVVSLCSLAGALLLAVSPALACENEASRQGPSLNLPQCRVYEQVTPVDKGDAIDIFRKAAGSIPGETDFEVGKGNAYVAEDGDAILLQTEASLGPDAPVLEGAYVFSRGAGGWSTDVEASSADVPQITGALVFDPADLSDVGFEDRVGTLSDLIGGDPSAYQNGDGWS